MGEQVQWMIDLIQAGDAERASRLARVTFRLARGLLQWRIAKTPTGNEDGTSAFDLA
jgi:hypothetical protein